MLTALERFVYQRCCAQVQILIDRIQERPEEFFNISPSVLTHNYQSLSWRAIALHGVFRPHERWLVRRLIRQISLKATRDAILDTLIMNGSKIGPDVK